MEWNAAILFFLLSYFAFLFPPSSETRIGGWRLLAQTHTRLLLVIALSTRIRVKITSQNLSEINFLQLIQTTSFNEGNKSGSNIWKFSIQRLQIFLFINLYVKKHD